MNYLGKNSRYRQFMRANSTGKSSNLVAEGDLVQIRPLGSGSFDIVILAQDREAIDSSQEFVAIKLLERGDQIRSYRTYVEREIENQTLLTHPLIVKIQQVFLTPTHLAIVMEYAAGGDLFAYIEKYAPACCLPEHRARGIFQQLILSLDYSHRRGVANRDLKLENLLLDRTCEGGSWPLLKICDFGYSKAHVASCDGLILPAQLKDMASPAKSNVGTLTYMAPELLKNNTLSGNKYDARKADIWSCGIILYAILFGQYPFDCNDREFCHKITRGIYAIPQEPRVSGQCLDMITRMLVVEPQKRICMSDIKLHPFFRRGLPAGALEMNNRLLQSQAFTPGKWEQWKASIKDLVLKATRVGAPDERLESWTKS